MLLRWLFVVLAAVIIAGTLYFLAASDDEDDEPPSTFIGTYRSRLLAAALPAATVVLEVREGGAAVMSTDFQNNQPRMVQEGTWVTDADALVVTFRSTNGAPLARPVMLSFVLENGSIRTVGNQELFGGQSISLVKD